MTTSRSLLALLLLTGAFAAGCGGDDNDSGGDTSTPAVTTTETAAETPTVDTATLTTEEPGGAEVPENIEAAIEQCKQGVDNTPTISDDLKDDLKQLCEEAASGDPEELKDIARQTCERVVEESLPAGEQRDAALKQCESAGG